MKLVNMITNEEYIQEYITTRGLSKSTYQSTKLIMNHYSNFQNCSIHVLINEADSEEEQGIRWKRRKLKTRLINYMNYLRENMTLNSAKTYLKIVKAFLDEWGDMPLDTFTKTCQAGIMFLENKIKIY